MYDVKIFCPTKFKALILTFERNEYIRNKIIVRTCTQEPAYAIRKQNVVVKAH